SSIYFSIHTITSHYMILILFFFSSRRRHTRSKRDWSSDVCSSDLQLDIQQLREGDRFAAYPPHSAPPALLAVQGQIITGRSTDQICFCEGLETLYTLVEAGFAFAVIADLPQLPMPEIQIIPVREVPPLSYGLSYRAGEM